MAGKKDSLSPFFHDQICSTWGSVMGRNHQQLRLYTKSFNSTHQKFNESYPQPLSMISVDLNKEHQKMINIPFPFFIFKIIKSETKCNIIPIILL